LQKGLKLSDFSPEISLKEVGRIERGEVDTIHDSTLESLARRLGVAPEGIETY
jgi:DNA-binding Xre family transcriptional regulator